jgi:hypothetical protein
MIFIPDQECPKHTPLKAVPRFLSPERIMSLISQADFDPEKLPKNI